MLLLVAVLILTQVIGIPLSPSVTLPLSLVLAALPGAVWLGLLYLAERPAPDVVQFMPTVVLLGALVAAAIGVPFLQQVVELDSWAPTAPLTSRFLANVLLVGPTHMFLVYAVVRYTVLRTQIIERQVDGILYTLATAVGYATMLNILLAIQRNGFNPAIGFSRAISDLVGHAAAAVVLGFFLGRNRFENLPFWYLPSGLMLAALVDGIAVYSRSEISRTSLSITQDGFSPWPGLVFNFFLAALSFAIIYGLSYTALVLLAASAVFQRRDFL